jgi:hypothetical protein
MLRAGRFKDQALERRLRLFALDVFFFGTAIRDETFSRGEIEAEPF